MKRKDWLLRCVILCSLAVLTLLPVLLLCNGAGQGISNLLAATDVVLSPKPRAFGAFHLVFLGICVAVTVLAMAFAWRIPAERVAEVTDRAVFACGVAFALLELYKQLYSTFWLRNGVYDFSIFPFQFCSLPIYICLLAPMLPAGRMKHTCYCFLAMFGTVGGYLVVGYPSFFDRLSLCLHTMVWHTLMIALGAFLLVIQRCGRSFRRDYLPSAGLFLLTLALATGMNVALEPIASRSGSVLNLFYLSPYHSTYFLLISDVQERFGWAPSVLCYGLLFLILGAFPLWLLGKGFEKLRFGRKK